MFGLFKKKKEATNDVVAPAKGKLINIEEVSDLTFSKKLLGDGFAIKPYGGTIVSPIDGEIIMIFPTAHAFGVKRKDGLEVLIHVGIDTVELKGKGFDKLVKQGDKVFAGDVCVKVDLETIEGNGYDSTIMTIFTSGLEESLENLPYGQQFKAGQKVLTIE